jgi:hypothetical protein
MKKIKRLAPIGIVINLFTFLNFSQPSMSSANAATKDCLQFSVENAYNVADFYYFSLYITNTCSRIVKLNGEFYAKTSNGSVFGRPSDAIIGLHGNNICGGGNYFAHYFNPKEQSSDAVCLSVRKGMTINSFFFANSPVSKPSLAKSVRMKLK